MSEDDVADGLKARRDEAEVRFWADVVHLRVLDGYCAGAHTDRTKAMNMILREWAEAKLHEATMVLRVSACNPTSRRGDGKEGGR